MKISALIKELEKLKNEHGDIPIKVQTVSHFWDPEPIVRNAGSDGYEYILLNP